MNERSKLCLFHIKFNFFYLFHTISYLFNICLREQLIGESNVECVLGREGCVTN